MPYFISSKTDNYQFLGRSLCVEGRTVSDIEVVFGKPEAEILELVEKDGNVIFRKVGEAGAENPPAKVNLAPTAKKRGK